MSCNNKVGDNSENQNPSKLYFGGDIITMVGDTPNYAEALVTKNGKIVFVGAHEEAKKLFKCEEVDLDGKTLLPGFIDGHAHFASFSGQAIGAKILPPPDAGASNIKELINILKEWNTPENRALTGWIFGMGFDDSVLEDKRFPTKHDLDQVSTEYPIMIIQVTLPPFLTLLRKVSRGVFGMAPLSLIGPTRRAWACAWARN